MGRESNFISFVKIMEKSPLWKLTVKISHQSQAKSQHMNLPNIWSSVYSFGHQNKP